MRPGDVQSLAVLLLPIGVLQPCRVTNITWPPAAALAPPVRPRHVVRLLDREARPAQAVEENLADGDAPAVTGTTETQDHQVPSIPA